ncbi:antA/AntB antirepressor family protein, partial [Bartonella sp. AA83SXKL]
MNTLIKITEQTIDQEAVQTVNARELHTFLEVKSNFRDWIKNRIEDYG